MLLTNGRLHTLDAWESPEPVPRRPRRGDATAADGRSSGVAAGAMTCDEAEIEDVVPVATIIGGAFVVNAMQGVVVDGSAR